MSHPMKVHGKCIDGIVRLACVCRAQKPIHPSNADAGTHAMHALIFEDTFKCC